jgi:hypothetical protein
MQRGVFHECQYGRTFLFSREKNDEGGDEKREERREVRIEKGEFDRQGVRCISSDKDTGTREYKEIQQRVQRM